MNWKEAAVKKPRRKFSSISTVGPVGCGLCTSEPKGSSWIHHCTRCEFLTDGPELSVDWTSKLTAHANNPSTQNDPAYMPCGPGLFISDQGSPELFILSSTSPPPPRAPPPPTTKKKSINTTQRTTCSTKPGSILAS